MAWEWVSPTVSGITSVVLLATTVKVARKAREHSDSIYERSAVNSAKLARESRYEEKKSEVYTATVVSITRATGDSMAQVEDWRRGILEVDLRTFWDDVMISSMFYSSRQFTQGLEDWVYRLRDAHTLACSNDPDENELRAARSRLESALESIIEQARRELNGTGDV